MAYVARDDEAQGRRAHVNAGDREVDLQRRSLLSRERVFLIRLENLGDLDGVPQILSVLFKPGGKQVCQRHVEEFLAAAAGQTLGRRIDIHDPQRFRIEDKQGVAHLLEETAGEFLVESGILLSATFHWCWRGGR